MWKTFKNGKVMKQVVRLKIHENMIISTDFNEETDSLFTTREGVEFVVIRRPNLFIKGHIYKKYIFNSTIVYEGDVIEGV